MNQLSKHSTAVLRTACAIVFVLFTFSFLFYYQADLLAYTQHVLSKGRTHYDATIGAVLITVVLTLISFGVWSATKLDKEFHSLVYFPSLLLLTMMTSAHPVSQTQLLFPSWLWLVPVLLVGYVVFIAIHKQYQRIDPSPGHTHHLMRVAWINITTLALMFLFVGLLSNHNNVIHYRLQTERLIKERRFHEALLVGKKSPDTDESLTMLRIFALSASHQLPEKLFTYPLKGASKAMTPKPGAACPLLLPAKIFSMQASRHATDYQLCRALLDKDIDRFAQLALAHRLVNDSTKLPRHYAEALTLYTHLRSNPLIVYKNNVRETDYNDFQKVDRETADERERKNRLHDVFGNTYWYYYQYSD